MPGTHEGSDQVANAFAAQVQPYHEDQCTGEVVRLGRELAEAASAPGHVLDAECRHGGGHNHGEARPMLTHSSNASPSVEEVVSILRTDGK